MQLSSPLTSNETQNRLTTKESYISLVTKNVNEAQKKIL